MRCPESENAESPVGHKSACGKFDPVWTIVGDSYGGDPRCQQTHWASLVAAHQEDC